MFDIWQEIYGTLKRNRLRTALTGFAVAWGIFMLIVLLGASNGLINAFMSNSEGLALNIVEVYPGITSKAYDGLGKGRRTRFYNSDVTLLSDELRDYITDAGGAINHSNSTASFDQDYLSVTLCGVTPNYVDFESMTMTKGRYVNQIDINERRKVAVMNEKSADLLFKHAHVTPIGQFITIDGIAYRVVGLYKGRENDNSNTIFIPFNTLQALYEPSGKLSSIALTTKNIDTEEKSEEFESEIRRVVASKHRFDKDDQNALWIWNTFSDYLETQTAISVLTIAMWVIGIFTLLSGVVGVSNIMLITVKERTHEFGIRKALGAKPRSILWLVVAESIFITTLFGYVGMVAGVGVTEWMNVYFGSQQVDVGVMQTTVFRDPTIDISVAIEATVTLIVAGTLAGFIPAYKAARIRPIVALNAN
jgi:putative ABC transport system permease protein